MKITTIVLFGASVVPFKAVFGCTDDPGAWAINGKTKPWCTWAGKNPKNPGTVCGDDTACRCELKDLYKRCPCTCPSKPVVPTVSPVKLPPPAPSPIITTPDSCTSLGIAIENLDQKVDNTTSDIHIKLERIEGKIDKVFSAVTPLDTLTCPDILRNFTYIFSGPGNNTSGTVSVDNPFTKSNQVSIEYTCDQQQQQCKLLTELNLNNKGKFLLASLDSSRVPAGSLLDGNYAFTDNSVGILTVNGMKTTYTKFEGLIEISNFTWVTSDNTVSFIANCANTTIPPSSISPTPLPSASPTLPPSESPTPPS